MTEYHQFLPNKVTIAIEEFAKSQKLPTANKAGLYSFFESLYWQNLSEKLKFEAQFHAGGARAANATLNEIYQICSEATGEKANWNGARPVREYVEALKRKADMVDELVEPLEDMRRLAISYEANLKSPDNGHAKSVREAIEKAKQALTKAKNITGETK